MNTGMNMQKIYLSLVSCLIATSYNMIVSAYLFRHDFRLVVCQRLPSFLTYESISNLPTKWPEYEILASGEKRKWKTVNQW